MREGKRPSGDLGCSPTVCFSSFYKYFYAFPSASVSLSIFVLLCLLQFLPASVFVSVGWTMLIFLLLVSLHHYRGMLRVSFTSFLPECALLRSEPFDVNGNSWLREIWWKVSRPVFTPSQMALNKLEEKAQIRSSQKGLI